MASVRVYRKDGRWFYKDTEEPVEEQYIDFIVESKEGKGKLYVLLETEDAQGGQV